MSKLKWSFDYCSAWNRGTALYVQWANRHGISYPRLMVLYALMTAGEMTQKEICEGFGLVKQTVNTVVRDLKKNKYIILKAGQSDRLEKNISLTGEGRIYAEKWVNPLLKTEKRIFEIIGCERMKQMQDTLELFNILFENEMRGDKQE